MLNVSLLKWVRLVSHSEIVQLSRQRQYKISVCDSSPKLFVFEAWCRLSSAVYLISTTRVVCKEAGSASYSISNHDFVDVFPLHQTHSHNTHSLSVSVTFYYKIVDSWHIKILTLTLTVTLILPIDRARHPGCNVFRRRTLPEIAFQIWVFPF